MPNNTKIFLRDLWVLTRPYWFSDERLAESTRIISARTGR